MIYKSKNGDINLAEITKLYPAGVVDLHGEVAEMSLEWMEMNEDKIKLVNYVLVFDSTPIDSDDRKRVVLEFDTKEELFEVMNEVAVFFQD